METISLFQNKNYKVHILVGAKSRILYLAEIIVDTRAVTNLVCKRFLKTDYTALIRPIGDHVLRVTTKDFMLIDGYIYPHIQMDELNTKAWFGVVDNFVIPTVFDRLTLTDTSREYIQKNGK